MQIRDICCNISTYDLGGHTMKGTYDQLERNLTASQTCDNSAFASLTDEEKGIIAALRDPKKAPQLYELMQTASKNQFLRANL